MNMSTSSLLGMGDLHRLALCHHHSRYEVKVSPWLCLILYMSMMVKYCSMLNEKCGMNLLDSSSKVLILGNI